MKTTHKTLAILKDGRRRGGLRIVRVDVARRFDALDAAFVTEKDGTAHFLPFSRLISAKARAALGSKAGAALVAVKTRAALAQVRQAVAEIIAQTLSRPADLSDENPPHQKEAGDDKPAAPALWYNREAEPIGEPAPLSP